MKIIGVTGKSGCGKSFLSRDLMNKLNNCKTISLDNLFSETMNRPEVMSRIESIFGDEAIKDGQIDLDTILRNKEIFDVIYGMLEQSINFKLEDEIEKNARDGADYLVIEGWQLPRTEAFNKCDTTVYVDIDEEKRLEALKKREKYITQEDIDIRDEVLDVDYEKYDYDSVIHNDHREETLDKVAEKLQSTEGVKYRNQECNVNVEKSERDLLRDIDKKYKELLSKENPEAILKTLQLLGQRRKDLKEGNTVETLKNTEDKETKRIIDLMEDYKTEIKQLFVSRGLDLTHITDVSPEEMKGGKIKRSKNRANNYETEIGDWTFASSEPVDGSNLYMARKSKSGMITITDKACIYGADNLEIEKNEYGENRVKLKEPNYVYHINPEDFTPVVTLRKNEDGEPYFEFSEEWISENDVDINDKKQVSQVEEIVDVTELVKNYQIFCDVNQTGEAIKLRKCKSMEEGEKALIEAIKDGRIRYINGETDINAVSKWQKALEPEKHQAEQMENDESNIGTISITKSIATGFAKEPNVAENKEPAYEAVSNTEHQSGKENQKTENEKDSKL